MEEAAKSEATIMGTGTAARQRPGGQGVSTNTFSLQHSFSPENAKRPSEDFELDSAIRDFFGL